MINPKSVLDKVKLGAKFKMGKLLPGWSDDEIEWIVTEINRRTGEILCDAMYRDILLKTCSLVYDRTSEKMLIKELVQGGAK